MHSSQPYKRFFASLTAALLLPALLVILSAILVDPYYIFGTPAWSGFNAVRPYYESQVFSAKPHQIERLKPDGISLGSSRVEVGIDPSHPGWSASNVFNYALPASTSYEVLLAFLHANSVARPLRQAVIGLDFFGFNILFPSKVDQPLEQKSRAEIESFADFLQASLSARHKHQEPPSVVENSAVKTRQNEFTGLEDTAAAHASIEDKLYWSERLYLALNPDVQAAINRGEFTNGRQHYELAGKSENRRGTSTPLDWHEALYLAVHADVKREIAQGTFISGYHHYLVAGKVEGREGGWIPKDWNEQLYLDVNPDVHNEIKRGTFISGYHHFIVAGRAERRAGWKVPPEWQEKLYLAVNADVADEIVKGTFVSGYHHYLAAGRSEGRVGGTIPIDWDETTYLQVNPDVEQQIKLGRFLSGFHHYLVAGRVEKRLGGVVPPDWNESSYLMVNPDVRIRLALGTFKSGYAHYAAIGRTQGRLGGFPPTNILERARLRWPSLNDAIVRTNELFQLTFSTTAIHNTLATLMRQSEPAPFNEFGVRTWSEAHYDELRARGGVGNVIRVRLSGGGWGPWLNAPKLMYCLSDPRTGMTMFDPYRYLLRQAYQSNVDVRFFISPTLPIVREMYRGLGIAERYEFWLRELVRMNEEEAERANRPAFRIWDFSDVNTITQDPVPASSDPRPMTWFWEHSHYRKDTGDLILDRIFNRHDAKRIVPSDFGVALDHTNIDMHILKTRAVLADWAAKNDELVAPILAGTRNLKDRTRQAEANCW